MAGLTLQRLAPWAGILFIVLFIVAFFVGGEIPGGDDPDSEIVAFYEDSSNQIGVIASTYVLTVAGVSFLIFLFGLTDRLRQAEAPAESLTRLAMVGGILFVAMFFVLAATLVAVAAGTAFQDDPVDAGVARFLPHVGFAALLIPGMFSAIVLILPTSVLTLRTRVLPSWTAWLGFLAAIILLFGALFVTGLAFLVWILVISIAMVMRPALQTI